MHARVGDHIVIKGHAVGEHDRDGEVIEIRGPGGEPPYVVHWAGSDTVTVVYPGPDAAIVHGQAGGQQAP